MGINQVAAIIESRSEAVTESGCWIWMRSTASHGYGDFRLNYKLFLAHRASYEAFVGPIPDGMFVLHRCDVKQCVNPDHLFLGTNADNMADKEAKGRGVPYTKGKPVIGFQVAQAIRKDRDELHLSLKELGLKYNLHSDTVRKITNFKIWKQA